MHFLRLISILLFTIDIINGNKLKKITLTSAITKPSTSPKPSTIYRRVNVHDGIWNIAPSYVLTDARRKKSKTNNLYINKMDTWCQFQPKVGHCDKFLQRYYYDLQMDRCVPFNYSGCGGNRNDFESLSDCEQLCRGVISSSVFTQQNSYKTICMLQPHTGMCLALITRYYYDINEKTCKKFIYGGCGGNLNRFDTLYSCLQACGDSD